MLMHICELWHAVCCFCKGYMHNLHNSERIQFHNVQLAPYLATQNSSSWNNFPACCNVQLASYNCYVILFCSHTSQLVYVHISQLVYVHTSQLDYVHTSQLVYVHTSQLVYVHTSQLVYVHTSQLDYVHTSQLVYVHTSQLVYVHTSQLGYVDFIHTSQLRFHPHQPGIRRLHIRISQCESRISHINIIIFNTLVFFFWILILSWSFIEWWRARF